MRARNLTPYLPAFVLGLVAAAAWAYASPLGTAAGSLRVLTEPSGIYVRLDGRLLGRTPLSAAVAAGAHQLQFERGGRILQASVDVLAGTDTTHHVVWPDPIALVDPLAAPAGELEIDTEPAGAIVEIDGTVRGRSPLSLIDVAAGDHEVVVRNQGIEHRRMVRVEQGALASLTITAPPTATSGWVVVQSGIPLQIIENGSVIGTTEAARTLMAVGRHDLELASDTFGFRTLRTVEVSAGRTTSIVIPPEQAPLFVNAVPWAEVFVDGVRVGETPLAAVMTPIGHHVVELSHPQLGKKQVPVQVSLKEPARVSVDMRAR